MQINPRIMYQLIETKLGPMAARLLLILMYIAVLSALVWVPYALFIPAGSHWGPYVSLAAVTALSWIVFARALWRIDLRIEDVEKRQMLQYMTLQRLEKQ